MMKKIFLTSLCSMLSFGAFATDMPQPSMGGPNGGGPRFGMPMMQQLTDEQKSCIEAYGCTMPEKPQMDEKAEKPARGERPEKGEKPDNGEKPEMTAEQKESMECMQKAMESCGIEMPKMPEGQGERPIRPRDDNQ